jgi:hypothetical protein
MLVLRLKSSADAIQQQQAAQAKDEAKLQALIEEQKAGIATMRTEHRAETERVVREHKTIFERIQT